jgi:hypothetical protein
MWDNKEIIIIIIRKTQHLDVLCDEQKGDNLIQINNRQKKTKNKTKQKKTNPNI